ncbi:MarR family transcriptional regulator [Nocardia sp. SYP-A9097]|uniref:MarR family winged helix-turn-helix transcriptional regulator n=1 Tax=Nocardia sp. SYP-A9097 TaxID=2663237 RepID=UPI00129BB1D6|nr:MarR family transcriptional regulator [Nocardia sp. SYP-A9097]MRH89461.1 MarR family transcriptional regulator [Nocardia sp. SYP-A9097]
MSDAPTPDEVWGQLTHLVMDTRDGWRRAVVERTGLPFSRFRVMKRLLPGPISVKQLAHAAAMDAPAATVTVNDLEERGLVVREIDPTNRRCKLVSLTPTGRELILDALATPDPAPSPVAALTPAELRTLAELLRKLEE